MSSCTARSRLKAATPTNSTTTNSSESFTSVYSSKLALTMRRASNKDNAMRIGISLTSNHPDVKDARQGARWMVERAAAAERAGLASLFIGDQHASPTPYYQNTP